MTYVLHKCSVPSAEWRFDSIDEVVDELRSHICAGCRLSGDEINGVVDVVFEGRTIECRDVDTLLSTACGLEYELEEKA